jgi:orotidine-5'-phosphate decarboxylase
VVGGTYPTALKQVRKICPDLYFLVPGIGAQKADLGKVVRRGCNQEGNGLIINASRSVIYAARTKRFDQAARESALALKNNIEKIKNLYKKA